MPTIPASSHPPSPVLPLPPGSPGTVLVKTVQATFTVEVAKEDFDAVAFKAQLAKSAAVDASAITLQISAGSIVVEATIATTSDDAAATVTKTLEAFVSSPTVASAALGVPVTAVANISPVKAEFIAQQPPSPAAPPPAALPSLPAEQSSNLEGSTSNLAGPSNLLGTNLEQLQFAVPIALILGLLVLCCIVAIVYYGLCSVRQSFKEMSVTGATRTADDIGAGPATRTADELVSTESASASASAESDVQEKI